MPVAEVNTVDMTTSRGTTSKRSGSVTHRCLLAVLVALQGMVRGRHPFIIVDSLLQSMKS